MANPVPRICEIRIGLVLNPPLADIGQVFTQVSTRGVNERPDDASSPGTNACEPGQSCTSNQLKEKGFRLIVLRVADRNPVGAEGVGSLLQKVISDPAGCVFD